MRGHVATTMVNAHTVAPINGRMIQIEDPIKATMKSTASTVRVMSRCISTMAKASKDFFYPGLKRNLMPLPCRSFGRIILMNGAASSILLFLVPVIRQISP
jgi:hypothetical protein